MQYPLSITMFRPPRQLSNGETNTFLYTIANISSIKYGTGIGYPSCKLYYSKYIGKSFETRNQGNFQLTLPLDEVAANGTFSDLKQTVCVGDDAPLLEMCGTLLTLYYKERKIQMVDRVIRVSPTFVEMTKENEGKYDVLLVSGAHFSPDCFRMFQYMFELLGLAPNFWDVEKYDGYSFKNPQKDRYDNSCIDKFRGKPIIFPNETNKGSPFEDVWSPDLYSHYKAKDPNGRDKSYDSGLLFVWANTHRTNFKNLFPIKEFTVLQELKDTDITDTYLIQKNVCESHMQSKLVSIRDKTRIEHPSKVLEIRDDDYQPKKLKALKWSFGTANIVQCPLIKPDRVFLCSVLKFSNNYKQDLLQFSSSTFLVFFGLIHSYCGTSVVSRVL
jgi:hypothetical protein